MSVVEIRFLANEFSREELEQALQDVLPNTQYTLTSTASEDEEPGEFLGETRHHYEPGIAEAFIVAIGTGVITNALYDALKYAIEKARKSKQAESPPAVPDSPPVTKDTQAPAESTNSWGWQSMEPPKGTTVISRNMCALHRQSQSARFRPV